MRRWKLAATAVVSSGVLAGGMFAAFNLTAQAATNTCTATIGTAAPTCTVTQYTMTAPLSVVFDVTTSPGGVTVDLSWGIYCTDSTGGTTATVQGSQSLPIPAGSTESASYTLADTSLPLAESASCTLTTATATQDTTAPAGGSAPANVTALGMTITYQQGATTSASPTASPTPTPSASSSAPSVKHYDNQVHGFDGTCADDKGNSSSKRAEVIIWTCNNTDQAQGWTYSGDELRIHGMCVNAKGNGKSGSKLILWSCTGSGNEIFVHNSKDEYVEKANGWSVCIDDPAYSTKNGTQLSVYKCNNGANQHWSLP